MSRITQQTGSRIFFYDVLRAYAITCVIFIHVSGRRWLALDASPVLYAFDVVLTALSHLSVPIFLTISGMLVLQKQQNAVTFYIRRFSRLLPPWFFYTAIHILITNYFLWMAKQPIFIPPVKHMMYSTFWFVPVIFNLYLVTPLIHLLLRAHKHMSWLLLGLWFVFFSIIPTMHVSLDGDIAKAFSDSYFLYYFGYYLAGYMLVKYSKNNIRYIFWIFCLSLVIQSIYLFWMQSKGLSDGRISYLNPFTVLSTISFVKLIQQSNITASSFHLSFSKLISFIAYSSYGIYLAHPAIQQLLRYSLFDQTFTGIHFPAGVTLVINTLLLLVFSASLVTVLSRIPILKHMTR